MFVYFLIDHKICYYNVWYDYIFDITSYCLHFFQLPPDPNLDKSQLVEMVQKLIEYSAKGDYVVLIGKTESLLGLRHQFLTNAE